MAAAGAVARDAGICAGSANAGFGLHWLRPTANCADAQSCATNAVLEVRRLFRGPGQRAARRQWCGRRLLRLSRVRGGARRDPTREGAVRCNRNREFHAKRAKRYPRNRQQIQHHRRGRPTRSANGTGRAAASAPGDQRASLDQQRRQRAIRVIAIRSQCRGYKPQLVE